MYYIKINLLEIDLNELLNKIEICDMIICINIEIANKTTSYFYIFLYCKNFLIFNKKIV